MHECAPTETPEVDKDALREKYLAERDKRLIGSAGNQYVAVEAGFEEFYEVDPYMPVVPRDGLDEDIDVAVLGGGFAGLIAGARLGREGVDNFRIIEMGGDFGGAWYWNRYPGIQVDSDAYCYLPLLEETGFMPSEKYTRGPEVFEYCKHMGRHFGLYEKALFHTRISSLEWDESIKRWRVGTNRGDDIRARFVVVCQGPTNKPKFPGVPGLDTYQGHKIHTARWDFDYTGGDAHGAMDKLADKRIAVIGTGASGIQVIPHLARAAKHVYVFQRTPSSIDERGGGPTDPEWVKTLRPGWQEERQRSFQTAAFEAFAPGQPDLVCDGWTEISRNLQAHLDATNGWAAMADPEKFVEIRERIDYEVMERLRQRIDAVVDDPNTAEILKPYYRFLCKRPCFNDEYLPTYNRPNVTLIDVSATKGVERITEKGIVADGVEHEVDCIVFASGFEITTDLDRRLGIAPFAGRKGLSLYDHWRKKPRTLHGLMTDGFPNMIFTGFIQGGVSASTTLMFEQQANHFSYIIRQALDRGASEVEPTTAAVDAWCKTVVDTAVDNSTFMHECTPGYYNNEGSPDARSNLGEPYWPGFYAMEDLLAAWRDAGDLDGMVLGR
ncbi:NAD(P)/FAD-dependent oxidoreductase [Yinghuangia sp. ASG 101]|uniref:flavin-containing monooxygenase n=1 Tax=Yinghuangia sp. ASG 101 TaxID=2896848 RepID=UPI001E2DC14C|nr:NAD(P)/FAD-dependent oxidoreductase [Yinghuangia sp. ASG 101]UGQ14041.1 NAD(P)/FAD-dependent oxidoreductase [Yinghuangia sp. ASG 101]